MYVKDLRMHSSPLNNDIPFAGNCLSNLSVRALAIDDVEWSGVEEFFSEARTILTEHEYKTLLEKAHRRFHPDKCRSRGLLNTVLDEDLRQRLEAAGNTVAQAITPVWRASRA